MMGFLHLFFVMFLITEDMNLSNPVENHYRETELGWDEG